MKHLLTQALVVVGTLFVLRMVGLDSSITGGQAFGTPKPKTT